MVKWYDLSEKERISQIFSKFSIKDFYDWWSDESNSYMEVRIKDFNLIKEVASKQNLYYSASGVYVRSGEQLKNVIAAVRDKATCWVGINPRKSNWNRWGKKQLGGSLVNVQSVNFLFIDIDRIKKLGPATNEELKHANDLADKILERLGTQQWNKNYCKVCSGNGCQLWIKLDFPIKLPSMEFDIERKEFKNTDEFDNFTNIIRGKIGKQLITFSNRYTKELGVTLDRACFNLAGVGALPVTKNFKYDGYTWRGIIEIKKEGDNIGLTDYIMGGITSQGKQNVFSSRKKVDVEDRLIAGKLREHPLVKFMLQPLPAGSRNNKLWFSFKCILRDSKIDMKSKEFKELHADLERLWNDKLTLNPVDKKFLFSRAVVNSYCIDNLIDPIYPVFENRIAKRLVRLEHVDVEDIVNGDGETMEFDPGTTMDEDMKKFDEMLVDKDYNNVAKYAAFLRGCAKKHGKERTLYYAKWLFTKFFCYR